MQPNELYSLIEIHAGELLASDASDAAIAAACNEAVIETRRDPNQLVTTRTMLKELTRVEFEAAMAAFEAAAGQSLYAKYSLEAMPDGFDFTDPDTIGFINDMRPAFGAVLKSAEDGNALADKLLAIGIKRESVFGFTVLVDDVAKARAWHTNSQRFTAAVSRGREVLDNGGTWEAAVAEFNA